MPLFDSRPDPHVYALPLGVDFAAELVRGLVARLDHLSPADQARTEIYVNTSRMQRRVEDLFDAYAPRLLPRVRLIAELANRPGPEPTPPAVSSLRKRLELVSLIRQLLANAPDIAPRTALFDLADSLAGLMDEMQGEGVAPDALKTLDVSDQSGHWQRALTFVQIVEQFLENSAERPDTEGRQRRMVEALIEHWAIAPPEHPIIIAGSTGSRGSTALFMQAVAALPQGAIVLPGYDFDLPAPVWGGMGNALTAEDHPQFRYRRLMDLLDITPDQIGHWCDTTPASPARNRLISLALRPAPVTDAWLTEGPGLCDLAAACHGLTLIEAPDPRAEAGAIALRLRRAVQDGQSAALITPDRVLTRQVTAALARWDILPDDSAGQPLPQSPPGRLLRQMAEIYGQRMGAEPLLRLLKHPLAHAGVERGPHLLRTRELELAIRKRGIAYPDAAFLTAWADKRAKRDTGAPDWVSWVMTTLIECPDLGDAPLTAYVADHIARTETLVAGPGGKPDALWQEQAGRAAKPLITELRQEAEAGGVISSFDYSGLLYGVLGNGQVRDRDAGHPLVKIWGTLEARVGGADLVILSGLNEGTWPEAPRPDPWLNRAMRARVGLLLPERQIGLSAHDFQQAAAAPEVVLTRALRSDDAQTVPARWVNRMTNLLGGLPDNGGQQALDDMRARGAEWVAMAQELERPDAVARAHRPSPCPPVTARPKKLSVTEVQTLLRDPYAIYAKHVLRLRALDPLARDPDARLRGTVLHAVLEKFIESGPVMGAPQDRDRLLAIADQVLAQDVPWSVTRTFYRGRIERFADWFIAHEAQRQTRLHHKATEVAGSLTLEMGAFTLTAKADRIDSDAEGRLALFDYKTGAAPTADEQAHFDKQLLLMSAMAEQGAFTGIPPTEVAEATYIALTKQKELPAPLDKETPTKVLAEFHSLIAAFSEPDKGYTSRRAPKKNGFRGDYDQLARYMEWEQVDDAKPEVLE